MIKPGKVTIVFLSGMIGSGKDEIGKRLVVRHGFHRLAFADALKRKLEVMNPLVQVKADESGNISLPDHMHISNVLSVFGGWDKAKRLPDVRRLLQSEGHSAREVYGRDIFCRPVAAEIREAIASRARSYEDLGKELRFVITDTRQLFEPYETALNCGYPIDRLNLGMFYVERPGCAVVNPEADSERFYEGLSYLAQTKIQNDGTIDDLHRFIDESMVPQIMNAPQTNTMAKQFALAATVPHLFQWDLIDTLCDMCKKHKRAGGGARVCKYCLKGNMR